MASGKIASTLLLFGSLAFGGTATAVAGSKAVKSYSPANASLRVCSGYGCVLKDRFSLTRGQQAKLRSIMSAGRSSANAERKAVARAIGIMERMARARLGYAPDKKKADNRYNGLRGQMDCVDESLNTTGYLTFLHSKGWLRHHKPRQSYAERGFILDGRYPHKSAVLVQKNGTKWAVDSWYGNDGQRPQVKPLSKWRKER